MDEKTLINKMKGLPIPCILYFDETDSTNERGLELIPQGAKEFTLIAANGQTAGRGRFGRHWVTTPGTSLAFSMVLYPRDNEIEKIGFFSFLGAVAICLAIESLCKAKPEVKWPNDVLLGGKKVAGILAETTWRGENLGGLILGMGINLLPQSVPPAKEVMFPASCIQMHCNTQIDQLEFLKTVTKYVIEWRPKILSKDFLEIYRSHLSYLGQSVVLSPTEGNSIHGELVGIDDFGNLILKDGSKKETSYPIGDLRLRTIP
jgi:BirA family transcriptional regulator, biotin operon repressor / biotin---[acetyl-CoA-carboxylase] ligase